MALDFTGGGDRVVAVPRIFMKNHHRQSEVFRASTLTEAKAQGQIRRFAQRQWVPTIDRRGTGKNAANLFGPAAVAGAKVLSVLTELGTNHQIIEKLIL